MKRQIKIKNLPEGYQSIITNDRHTIFGDEPIKSKGTDLGFAPTDLLLAGLGMCKVATVRFIARKNGWEIGNVHAEFGHEVKRGDNATLGTTVQVKMHIEGNLSEAQRQELLQQADNCYVHRMIDGSWDIGKAGTLSVQEIQ